MCLWWTIWYEPSNDLYKGGFVVQRHNELRDFEAELLNLVCKDVETEPVLQDIMGEVLGRGANTSQEARVDIHVRFLWC